MKRSQKTLAIIIWSIVGLLLLVGGIYFSGLLSRVPGVAAVVEPDHAERESVRAWLRENTDSGEWEEVRWWRFTEMKHKDYHGNPIVGDRMVRLKYRTHSGIAGRVLVDSIFSLSSDGKIDRETWPTLKEAFPD